MVWLHRACLAPSSFPQRAKARGVFGVQRSRRDVAGDQRPSLELAALPGVVATPHLGGLTPENADAQAASSVEQVAAMIAGDVPPRSLNAEHATRLRALWTDEGDPR